MFNLKDFQSQVFTNYKSLKRGFDDAVLFAEKGSAALIKNPKHGLVKRNIMKILVIFKIKFHNFYIKSAPFVKMAQKAEEIIENPKIKKIFCARFKKKISTDFFIEELEIEVINTLTASLTKHDMAEEFSIENDKLLFSMMAYKILQKGIENYCAV
jgi:hypothetical protein